MASIIRYTIHYFLIIFIYYFIWDILRIDHHRWFVDIFKKENLDKDDGDIWYYILDTCTYKKIYKLGLKTKGKL